MGPPLPIHLEKWLEMEKKLNLNITVATKFDETNKRYIFQFIKTKLFEQ